MNVERSGWDLTILSHGSEVAHATITPSPDLEEMIKVYECFGVYLTGVQCYEVWDKLKERIENLVGYYEVQEESEFVDLKDRNEVVTEELQRLARAVSQMKEDEEALTYLADALENLWSSRPKWDSEFSEGSYAAQREVQELFRVMAEDVLDLVRSNPLVEVSEWIEEGV